MSHVGPSTSLLSGRSSSSSSSSSEPAQDIEDVVRIFGLGQRDLARGPRFVSVADLSPRQQALCMSGCSKQVSAADLLDIGGEAESCISLKGR